AAADGVLDPRRPCQAAAEAELGKSRYGPEDLVAQRLIDARRLRASAQEIVAEGLHRRDAAVAVHGPAEAVGPGRSVAAQVHGDLQDLLLEEAHAQGVLADRPH